MPETELIYRVKWNSDEQVDVTLFKALAACAAEARDRGAEVSVVMEDQGNGDATKQVPPARGDPPRGRGRPRKTTNGTDVPVPPQAAAAPAPVTEPPLEVTDIAGDDAPEDEAGELGLNDGGQTAAEAHGYAMGGVRMLFNVGHKDDVYTLRKKYGVTKFDEIPTELGHQFANDVAVLMERHGMHL